jgi:hypothetical protein
MAMTTATQLPSRNYPPTKLLASPNTAPPKAASGICLTRLILSTRLFVKVLKTSKYQFNFFFFAAIIFIFMLISNYRRSSIHSLKIDKHRQDNEGESSAGNFLSSVLSAAQNVTSVLRGNSTNGYNGGAGHQDHKRSASDGSFFGFINDAAQPFNDPLHFIHNDSHNDNGNSSNSNFDKEGTGNATKAADVKIAPIRSAVATIGKGELSLESLGLVPEDSNPSSPVLDPSNNFSDFSTNAAITGGTSGQFAPSLERNDSQKVPDLNVTGPPPLPSVATAPAGFLSSSAFNSTITNGRESERKSRRSLIGRRSTERPRTSFILDNNARPLRSLSVNSLSRRHRGSFSEDLDFSANNTSNSSNGDSTAVLPTHGADSQPPLRENNDDDSDSSDRPRPRADHDNNKHLAGFAYANKKRNQDFHKLFRSLPPNDFLLDDFSCALSKEILVQGRMYVSERNICFNSNILGWVTNLIISFDEIVGLEKRATAGLFPNGIVVHSLHAKHTFASFISRDTVFEFLMSIWRQTNSRIDLIKQSKSDGLSIADSEDDNEDEDNNESDSENDNSDRESNSGFEEYSDSDEDDYDEESEDDDDDIPSDQEFGESARRAKPASATSDERKTGDGSGAFGGLGGGANGNVAGGESKWPAPNLGAETHGPTDPGFDYEAAGEKLLINETIHAPLGVVANLLFGDNVKWITKFITDTERNFDLKNFGAFDNGLVVGSKRVYEYTKPLNGPVGPKQTKCMCTDTIEHWDLDGHVTVITTTSTPDVPSGGAFTTKTRYTIYWTDGNATKLMLSYLIDWTGKSWFKGPIEKGTHDGQTVMAKHLIEEIEKSIKKGGAGGTASKAKVSKGKKGKVAGKKKKPSSLKSSKASTKAGEAASKGLLTQILDLLQIEPIPMVSVPLWRVLLIVFFLYLFISWLFGESGADNYANGDIFHLGLHKISRDKLELLRLEEEYNIWHWLEDRSSGIGFREASAIGKNGAAARSQLRAPAFDKAKYYEQDLREAIKLTELRVRELKRVLNI